LSTDASSPVFWLELFALLMISHDLLLSERASAWASAAATRWYSRMADEPTGRVSAFVVAGTVLVILSVVAATGFARDFAEGTHSATELGVVAASLGGGMIVGCLLAIALMQTADRVLRSLTGRGWLTQLTGRDILLYLLLTAGVAAGVFRWLPHVAARPCLLALLVGFGVSAATTGVFMALLPRLMAPWAVLGKPLARSGLALILFTKLGQLLGSF